MKFLLPILIVVLGIVIGGAAGHFLAPDLSAQSGDCACEAAIETAASQAPLEDYEYLTFDNPFVVPVVENDALIGMVVLSLSLELTPDSSETVYGLQPKLRDEFLRVLFAYASLGGFRRNFMQPRDLEVMRKDLTEAAQKAVGEEINQVLIVDMVRQDL